MPNRKVLVNYLGRKGGGAVYAFEMTKGLVENGEEVSAVVPSGLDNLDLWEKLHLKSLYIIDTYDDRKSFVFNTVSFLLFKQWSLRKKIKEESFDYCYIPMIQPWTCIINNMLRKTRIIATLHDPVPHSGSNHFLQYLYVNKFVAQKADKIIILSSTFKELVKKNYKKKDDEIKVIPHGIFDYSSCTNGKIIQRNKEYNFLFFGLIEKYKGLNILLPAYNQLKKQYDTISLYIVGKGDLTAYKNMIDSGNDITVVNRFIDDSEVESFFVGHNIITVLPYIDSTQSGVIPIAMKEGSLLIATRTGGLVEQTGNGQYALLCEPRVDDLFKTMEYAITHYHECKPIIDRAREYSDKLTWKNLAKEIFN